MSKVIGIDLGTTNSCVAVMENSKATVIPNSEGSRTTPSVVGFSENGERLVGQIAKRQALTNATNTIYAVKRLMGCVFNSPEAKRAQESVPYKVVASSNGDAWLDIREKLMSPPEVSSMILANIKNTAEEYLGEPVTEAVVTVPAYFNDSQRQATKDAGRIAGLNVLRIINEPTAAAVAYGMDGSTATGPERVAVYDLGGGTFDISILELNAGVFEVKSTNGDTFLGGEDFDNRIVDELATRFERANNGLDLRKDRNALQRLKDAAERAKQELSSSTETEVNIPFIIADAQGPKHMTETITRDQLEELVKDLIERTIQPCATALKDAGLTPAQISQVLLVGGMTRMPAVQKKVKQFFGKEPHKGINPDEVVAIGAAIQGGVLRGEVQDVLLLDVTPLSLGVETAGGLFTKIINKNTTIPCKGSQIFSTASDHQAHVNVHVLQGERELAADNKTLARFELVGIPPAPRGVPQIEVTFDIDANGIVGVSAKDLGSGRVQQVHITSHSGLSEAEIQKALAEAQENQESDKKLREIAELKNGAEGLIYTTEKSLEEYASSLSEKDRTDIQNDLQRLKKDLASGDEYKIRNSMKQLEGSAYRIADAIYGASQQDPKTS